MVSSRVAFDLYFEILASVSVDSEQSSKRSAHDALEILCAGMLNTTPVATAATSRVRAI